MKDAEEHKEADEMNEKAKKGKEFPKLPKLKLFLRKPKNVVERTQRQEN